MKKHFLDVLNLLKTGVALSATDIEKRLNLPQHPKQKEVRSAIDYWRYRGEPIWHDEQRGAFWWNRKWPVGVGPGRWKRTFSS